MQKKIQSEIFLNDNDEAANSWYRTAERDNSTNNKPVLYKNTCDEQQ